jgi:CheY-like chemotaxis protein
MILSKSLSLRSKPLQELPSNPNVAKEEIQNALVSIKNHMEAISICTQHSTIITNDVLDLSRLETNNKKLDMQPFSVRDMMQGVVKMFQAKLKEKNLDMILGPPEEDLYVKGDRNCVEQVLINLITNAIKFTERGHVKFMFRNIIPESDDHISLQFDVEDTGIGMNEEERRHLFNRFEQSNKWIKHDYGGSGLGLYISKQLVQLMGGTFIVKSEKGSGSLFSFTVKCLMLSPEEEKIFKQKIKLMESTEEGSIHTIKENCSKINILIVEDNLFNQKIIAQYLSEKGYRHQIANDGQEALQKWRLSNFDLIFMDVEMPIMGGLEATRRIRKEEKLLHRNSVPIIGLSGNARIEQKNDALKSGMTDYLIKPCKRQDIYGAIWNALNLTGSWYQPFRDAPQCTRREGELNTALIGNSVEEKISPQDSLSNFLISSVLAEDVDGINYALNRGASPNTTRNTSTSETALYLATKLNSEQMVKLLLEKRANPNANGETIFDRTPLHVATSFGNNSIIKLLLDHGAIVQPDRCGDTPRDIAMHQGFKESAMLLSEYNPILLPPPRALKKSTLPMGLLFTLCFICLVWLSSLYLRVPSIL